LLVIVATALAVMYAVPAVAEERWWWVSSPDDPRQPVTQVLTLSRWTTQEVVLRPAEGAVPTTRFNVRGVNWTLQAFVSKGGDLCMGVVPDPPSLGNDVGGGVSCYLPFDELRRTSSAEWHWVGFTTMIPGRLDLSKKKFLYGPAAENVDYVDLENSDGRGTRVPTIAPPKELGEPARFWIAVLPIEHVVHTLVPRDEDGKALEHWRLPQAF
jgi:hypothetical protein